jgi:hydrogenase maturation protease
MRVLVAGIGNIFLGDDGFGVEVAQRLSAAALPPGVEVLDVGIRGLHLAYRLLDGYDLVIAVDAVARGGPPGTVYVLEPDALGPCATPADAHGMNLESVFAMVRTLGGTPGRVLVVGCEPADLGERIGLSAPVARAVAATVQRVREIAERGGCSDGKDAGGAGAAVGRSQQRS